MKASYRLLPNNQNDAYYRERTDRNIGWITRDEQEMVRRSVIGVAGCGGMGGAVAEKFLRLGVGELRIADSEVFDVSNINRQLAACRSTVGRSKADETAKALREITDDSTIVVYPSGISEATVDEFLEGCDLVCDEIEFWCVGSRILLHQRARQAGVPLFVCNTIGFGSHVFLFTPQSGTMEECLGMDYAKAKVLEAKITGGTATKTELARVMQSMVRGLFPEWREYVAQETSAANEQGNAALRTRLLAETKGAIIATNPPLACGLLADRVLLYLLRRSGLKRNIVEMPEMPGYLYLDAATMEAKVKKGKWWQ